MRVQSRVMWELDLQLLIHIQDFISSTMMQQPSRHSLKLSTWDRRAFANAVEGLDTRLMPELSMALNYPHQVLEKYE